MRRFQVAVATVTAPQAEFLRGDPSNPVKSVLLIATDPFGELERRLFKTRC